MKKIEMRGKKITVPKSLMKNPSSAEATPPDDKAEREPLRRARVAVKM